MKIRTLLLSLFAVTLIPLSLALASSFETITCHTPRMRKSFVIKKNMVTFYLQENRKNNGRELASISNVRTKNTQKGFTKIVYFENHKHVIHIDNANNFSEAEDYLIVKSKKGHEITYPLNCSLR